MPTKATRIKGVAKDVTVKSSYGVGAKNKGGKKGK
jgi:hypothetical protein